MKKHISISLTLAFIGLSASSASALEIDWSGQLRADINRVENYTLDNSTTIPDPNRQGQNGYYITPGGNNSAFFETLFFRLKPKIVVNDNIYIKSEWWIGDPAFGLYGDAVPPSVDQRQFFSTQNRGAMISAQRYWGEFVTDIGTVQVGRAPLDWGLGLVWSAGDGLWDHYESTADVVRLYSKFGALSIQPSFNSYSTGNAIGGACTGFPCGTVQGSGGVADYSLALKYENLDEDFEGGLNFIKRIAGASQDSGGGGYLGPDNGINSNPPLPAGAYSPNVLVGATYNVWDLYAKKKFGKLALAGEVPIASGSVGGSNYSTWALAGEANLRLTDMWETQLKFGHAPGQPGGVSNYSAFYFNPNYRLGVIMFNYQFANFAGPNTVNNPNVPAGALRSPYDNPIVNANYLYLKEALHTDKWTFYGSFVTAQARETAQLGQVFLNTNTHSTATANGTQSNALGWEMDWGTAFQWDEYLQFKLDTGFFFPGAFWKFSNQPSGVAPEDGSRANNNGTSMAFAAVLGVGVSF